MDEYYQTLELYLSLKSQPGNHKLEETIDKYTVSNEGTVILEITKPKYKFINKELLNKQTLLNELGERMINYSRLSKTEFISIQKQYNETNAIIDELTLQLEEMKNKIDQELLIEKDKLEEILREIYNQLKTTTYNTLEWKELAKLYIGVPSDNENPRTKLKHINLSLEKYITKNINIDSDKKFVPMDINHPMCYINYTENKSQNYIVTKEPIVEKNIKLQQPVRKTIKIKPKKNTNKNTTDCRLNPDRCNELGIEKGKELICNPDSGRCVNKPQEVVKKTRVIKPQNSNDCRLNPDRCNELGIEKGKELVCNPDSGRCVNKPKKVEEK